MSQEPNNEGNAGNKLIHTSNGPESTVRAGVSASSHAAALVHFIQQLDLEMLSNVAVYLSLNLPICLVGTSGDELGQQASGLPFVYLL